MAQGPVRPKDSSAAGGFPPSRLGLSAANDLFAAGRVLELAERYQEGLLSLPDQPSRVRLTVTAGMAYYELGNVLRSLELLNEAYELAKTCDVELQFQAALALFSRESQFQTPDQTLPALSKLRQLASSIGERTSVGGLHFVVARLEALRGHCIDARRHAEIGRHVLRLTSNIALRSAVELVDSGLETNAGNLGRAARSARAGLDLAESVSLLVTVAGCLVNLGSISLFFGDSKRARHYVESALQIGDSLQMIAVSGLDNLAQINLYEGDLRATYDYIEKCKSAITLQKVPSRSWPDLYHQLTRCAYYERTEEWRQILDISDEAEPELVRRQYKALRATLLCAKARALARLARFAEADRAVAAAVRACPRGGVDPLIVLEATRAVCLNLRGESARASVHFDRAIAGCHAIGHRYHEAWITRARSEITSTVRGRVPVERRDRDLADTALVLTDVAAILGAGHSIDLLTHRVCAILQSTPLGARVTVDNESGCEFHAQPSAVTDSAADGTFTLTLRGSDRRAVLRVRSVETIDEIAMLKGLSDLVQAAVNRATDSETEDDEQNLWPRMTQAGPDEVIFRSPRMAELLKIALRLADTTLPVLITGETGTGKEILARIIHDASRVKRGPFVPFNCAATPRDLVESQLFGHRRGAFTGATDAFPGVIRSAENGTLFLDEIGDLDHAVQPKLLRFLESGEIHTVGESRPQRVTVRVIAATNADIPREVHLGGFRRDLFYRIGAPLHLPPLRERKDEIPALAALFIARYARELGRTGLRLGDDFIAALLLYDWPGNIRELANEVRRVVAMADDGTTLGSTSLAPDILQRWNERPVQAAAIAGPLIQVRLDQTLAQAVRQLEEQFIDHALATTGGRVTEAAGILGLSRKGLFLKRRRRGLVGGRPDVLP